MAVPKGGGAENMSRVQMLAPSAGVEGIKDYIVNRIREAGSNPCPPVIVGVGIGGTFERTAILAKKALLRKLGDFRREYIGFVFQSFQLIPYLTVLENVMLPLTIVRGSNGGQKEAASQVLDKVGLGAKGRRLPNQLSGGEQERVAIARALVNHPPIILADEPTGNLDSATGDEIMALLGNLNAEGQTIIMVTHNPENAASAREVIHLKDGKIQG